jgi:transcription initiation factor TFIIIB Brf1 subunit/transcription initiation factor TFIIB
MSHILDLLGLPGVKETARSYLKLCLTKRLQRGPARQGTVVACIFHACRTHDAPRTARELEAVSRVPTSIIKDACKRTAPFIKGHERAMGGLRETTLSPHAVQR